MRRDIIQKEPLDQDVSHAIEEARMVLPGIQALFGFQLIAVFNSRFETELLPYEQRLHLAAVILVAVAILLIMAPAAYHRQAERGLISSYFTELASTLLTCAMAPLMLGIVLEVFLVSQVVLRDTATSVAIGAVLFVTFVGLWFVFPRMKARQRQAELKAAR